MNIALLYLLIRFVCIFMTDINAGFQERKNGRSFAQNSCEQSAGKCVKVISTLLFGDIFFKINIYDVI